jgi:hypothetical protein
MEKEGFGFSVQGAYPGRGGNMGRYLGIVYLSSLFKLEIERSHIRF